MTFDTSTTSRTVGMLGQGMSKRMKSMRAVAMVVTAQLMILWLNALSRPMLDQPLTPNQQDDAGEGEHADEKLVVNVFQFKPHVVIDILV
jgi:hypothetical protein